MNTSYPISSDGSLIAHERYGAGALRRESREKSFLKSFYFGMVCLVLFLPGSLVAWDNGTPPPTAPSSPTPVESHPLGDRQELETFVDGVMN